MGVEPTHTLCEWTELPEWSRIDPYIRHGYRRPLGTAQACFWSLFYPHNELINTWSHLIPGLYFTALLLLGPAEVDPAWTGTADEWLACNLVLQIYMACTALCLLFSAIYHISNAHSRCAAHNCLKLDYLGIVLSITGSIIASTYMGLRRDPHLQGVYMSLTIACAVGVFSTLLGPHADGPAAARWRVSILVALFCTQFLPMLHLIFAGRPLDAFPLPYTAATGSCYLVGTIFYVAHFPEKFWPRQFDFVGASHQIFHILVAIGQLIFFVGLQRFVFLGGVQNAMKG